MKKNISVFILALLMALVLCAPGCKASGSGPSDDGTAYESEIPPSLDDDDREMILEKIDLIDRVIGEYFMDPNDLNVTKEDMIEGIYEGYVNSLGDEYTEYMDAETYKFYKQSLEGTYRGIGILVNTNSPDGKAYIKQVYKGGTAEEAGILEGDMFVEVDGMEVSTDNIYEVISHIRSTEGTVHITMYRPSTKEYLDFAPETTDVELPTVYSEVLEDGTGYIEISSFTYNTVPQFRDAYDAIKDAGADRLIIDLRNNGGGLVSACCDILDIFMEDCIFMSTVDKFGGERDYNATSGADKDIKIAVLVNGDSASASEIFAGAMKDNGRAKIIGTQTFGKGIIQATIELGDGSAVKITYSAYKTPSGAAIHGVGITPDMAVELPEDAETDVQLEAAQKYLNE